MHHTHQNHALAPSPNGTTPIGSLTAIPEQSNSHLVGEDQQNEE